MPPFEAPSVTASESSTTVSSHASLGGQSRGPSSHHLRPEDAISGQLPSRRLRKSSPLGRSDTITANNVGSASESRRKPKERRGRSGRSGSRRTKGTWKKLLWVKQAYPDNYTDEETFLDHLQRNPRLRPYEFWPLVADSTIIVQHICSVIIFVCCFTGIFQERVSPVVVVSWATIGTVLGWVLRDYWVTEEEAAQALNEATRGLDGDHSQLREASLGIALDGDISSINGDPRPWSANGSVKSRAHSRTPSETSARSSQVVSPVIGSVKDLGSLNGAPMGQSPSTQSFAPYGQFPPYEGRTSSFSPRNQERLATAKSAILIYCALLGLSPILKSLTQSTSPDSIWAISSWLIVINVFTFDYGAGIEAKFPASLSTNAALMASTVLASRLPTTTHVFSLTLFSIEVFGLFPVFRRHVRHVSWSGHLLLTTFEVVGAGGGLCLTITGGGWPAALIGVVLGGILTCLAMGMTSWWLIGLQRYKNEIRGPWDPARPIIRRHWD